MGFCAPVLMGLLLSRRPGHWTDSLISLGFFLAGRLIAYLIFGVVSYLVGETLVGQKLFIELFPLCEILLGMLMAVYALWLSFPHWSFCHGALNGPKSHWALFAAGAFTGANLCPPFILALGAAMQTGSIAKSVLFFFVFFVATSVYLIPFAFSGLASRQQHIRSASRILCGLTGIWFVAAGVWKLID